MTHPHTLISLSEMKVIWYFLSILLFSIIYGCSNDDNVISSLCFEKEYYEKPMLENSQEIVFSGGSNNLSIEVSDDDVLEATISDGKIKIKTKKKGFVYLVVKDNIDNTSITIRVKVVDCYLSLRLGYPIPNNSYYKKGDCLFLVNDENRSIYLYDESYSLKETGNYKLFMDNSSFFLSLYFAENIFLYDISNSSYSFLWGAIPNYLDFSWTNGEVVNNSRAASPVSMTAVEIGSDNVYYFYLDDAEIPYSILN